MTANGYAELAALLARGFRQLRVVNDCADEQRLIDTFSKPKAPTVLRFNLVAGSSDYYSALAAADVLLRVDPGMTFLLRRLGLAPGLDMSGTDFIPKLLAAFRGGKNPFGRARCSVEKPYFRQMWFLPNMVLLRWSIPRAGGNCSQG